ncbi:MAG: hypothetical protein ACK48F_03790, partial [Chryseotalea sp.]
MIKISISEISQNLVSFIRYCILIKFILFEFKMAQCQEKRILKVDDIFNSFNVAQAKFSPDDKWAVVVIERPRKDQLVYGINFINRFDIWLLNVQSNS